MSLLQKLTKAFLATILFYVLFTMFDWFGLLSMPDRMYNPFGLFFGFIYFIIMVWQLPDNKNANNKSAGKAVAKAVG